MVQMQGRYGRRKKRQWQMGQMHVRRHCGWWWGGGARGAVVAEPGGVRRRCAVGGAAGTMAGLNTVVSARNGSESGGAPAVALRQDSDASARPSVRGASHGSLRPTSCWLR